MFPEYFCKDVWNLILSYIIRDEIIFYEILCCDDIKRFDDYRKRRVLLLSIKLGNHNVVKWFERHTICEFDKTCVQLASENGHLDMLKWMHQNGNSWFTKWTMDIAVIKGHTEVVKWLTDDNIVVSPANPDCTIL